MKNSRLGLNVLNDTSIGDGPSAVCPVVEPCRREPATTFSFNPTASGSADVDKEGKSTKLGQVSDPWNEEQQQCPHPRNARDVITLVIYATSDHREP